MTGVEAIPFPSADGETGHGETRHGETRHGEKGRQAAGCRWSDHGSGQWSVRPEANAVREEYLTGGQPLRAFMKRPESYDAMFRASVARNPTAEAVVCGTRRLSYGELDAVVERTAGGLGGAGLRRGDRVAIMLDNRLEYLVAVLATIRAGGIAVPLGTRLGPDDVSYIVGNCEPAFVITANEWSGHFALGRRPWRMLLVDAAGTDNDFASLESAPQAPLPRLNQGETMMIVYTSGTTGKPKGACLTHLNFVHTSLHYVYALSIDRPQRSLLVVPATHIAGFGPVISTTLASGGSIVMMREFKSRRVLETIAREKITFTVLVPAMYQLCLMGQSVDEFDLSTWTYGVYGGAVMPPAVIERVVERLPALRMINAYGATETCAVCTIMPPELTIAAPASVGMVLHCDELRIVDETGAEVPVGQSGEIWIRGPNVSPGYWRDPDATAKAFTEGFWRSGDIGSRDESGLVYVHDRLKDMINRGGFKVFSAEVENALMGHPDVADCAVVGVADPVLGEKTFALVERRAAHLDSEALRTYLLARIADYKVPDFWHVGEDAVPRNQNGKQQKADIRHLAQRLIRGIVP